MIKEVCKPCSKTIKIGQSLLECEVCNSAIHAKCSKIGHFKCLNSIWTCSLCAPKVLPRYNPFKVLTSEDSDKFYDDPGTGNNEVLEKISSVLEDCQIYNTQELNAKLGQLTNNNAHNSKSNTLFSSFFLNIDGNNTNFNSLIAETNSIAHKFSVIGLAETNTDQPLQNLYQLSDYTSFYQSTLANKAKGTGVALYVLNELNAEPIDKLSLCTPDIESVFAKVSQPSSGLSLTVGVVYRPPNGDFANFMRNFEQLQSQLPSSGVRILGDFNIDLLKLNSSSSGNHANFEENFIQSGLAPLISIPTHTRANCQPSCIDNIFTNDIDAAMLSGCISCEIGDHSPIFEVSNIDVEIVSSASKGKHVKYYDFSNKNVKQFMENLELNLSTLEVTEKFSDFTDAFGTALDSACKLENPKITKRSPVNNPWITDALITSIDRKHELKSEWTNSISKDLPNGNPIMHKAFVDYRRALKSVINSAKNLYNCNRILEHKNDRKKTWEVINELRGKGKKSLKPCFMIDNQKIVDRRIIANEFNKYFNSIASKLNESIADTEISEMHAISFEDYLAPPNPNSIFLQDCCSSEILEIVQQLDNNKSSDIPIRIIKKSVHIFAPILSNYFTLLMSKGIFPDVLKVGKVTPIFKKGSPDNLGNYRPVSTLPIFGKLFEKIIYSRVYSYALSQNILNKNQFGFRKSHSTSHAVNYSTKIIGDCLKRRSHVLGIFIDLSKAFDTIDHSSLLVKLNRYGIRGNAHSLLKSYLSNRVQYTEVLGEKSDPLIVQYGVPQGSVLGPLLFLLYINDISNSSDLAVFILFADDTNIFIQGNTIEEVYRKGNKVLSAVRKYMLLNKLHINMSKCCYIHFRPNTKSKFLALMIMNTSCK